MSKHRHRRHHHKHRKKLPHPPKPENVDRFLRSVVRRVKKKGARYYKKRRTKVDKTIQHLLKRYHLKGTLTENYWQLKAVCVLIGKEPAYI